MEKYQKILSCLNRHPLQSQRSLAEEAGYSLGLVNGLLKDMTKAGYLAKSGKTYIITPQGEAYLEAGKKKSQVERMTMKTNLGKVRTGVILAAGANAAFDCPTGLLRIHGVPLIEYIIRDFYQVGIENIYIVTGSMEEQYQAHFRGRNITLISNPRYKWSGTMESLAQIDGIVKEDFLLVESNLIFEESAIIALADAPYGSCLILTAPSGSGDEAYVELNQDRTLNRIAKDIRQLNHIDGEMPGISKIAYPLFQKMMEYFAENTNPMLNYEYVIETIGKLYQIHGVLMNDMAWSVIEDEKLFTKAEHIIYPRIKKKEQLRKENHAKEILKECMHLSDEDIAYIRIGGGMTNTNFFTGFAGSDYILRVPGAGTDKMINRKREQHNGVLACALGINPAVVYFDTETGIKITECVMQAETLNGKTARLEANIKKTTAILRQLHDSELKLYDSFSVVQEYEKYRQLIQESGGEYYPGFDRMHEFFYQLQERLAQIGLEKKPCHNDLVAENFVKDGNGKMYLIDWEYSGYYDPTWDLASHLLECEFLPAEEELFLKYYYPDGTNKTDQEKIIIFKICQDILWSAWTVLKESHGEDFGTYGKDRLQRAMRLREEYERDYEKL